MKSIILSILIILNSALIQAQNWTGAVSTDWNNPANWSSTPTNNTAKVINPANYTGAAHHPVISSNSSFTPGTVSILNGGQLTINANLSTNGNVTVSDNNSQLIVNAGVFEVAVNNNGRLIVELGATMTINNGTINVGQRFISGENSIVTMYNGTVTTGQRLLMDLGGIFIFNGGNITVAQTMALADGNVNGSCQFNMNGGNLTVNGEIALENEFGVYEPTVTINGGTLTLNGDLVWFGETPGAGTPKFIMNGGTANISGLIQNMPLSTVNMYLKLQGNAQLNYSGNLIESIHPQDSIIQIQNSQLFLNNNHTINNSGVIYAQNVSTNFNTNSILQGNGHYQFHTVELSTANTINQQTAHVFISGNLNVNGNFITNNNTVTFNGSANQTINGNNINFYNLTINNSSSNGVSLNTTVNVTGALQLNNGKLNTSNTHIITIEDNATATSGNINSFVNGPIIKKGDDAFVFPVGKNMRWRRLSISAPNTTTASFKAEYFDNTYSQITPVNSPLSAISNIEHWNLERLNSSSNVVVSLYWEDASASAITDCNELSIARWNTNAWENVLSTANGICNGNGNGYITSNNILNDFGTFTFGFYSNVTTQNIDLCIGDSVIVGNNTYYTSGTYINILTDINNNDSVVITNVNVISPDTSIVIIADTLHAVNSNASYQWVDCSNNFTLIPGATSQNFNPLISGNYAVIINQNGCIDTSSCYFISLTSIYPDENKNELKLFPNPIKQAEKLNLLNAEKILWIEIYDLTGKLIKTINNAQHSNSMQIDINLPYSNFYIIKTIDTEGYNNLFKIIIL
jgi:hypothetical protein